MSNSVTVTDDAIGVIARDVARRTRQYEEEAELGPYAASLVAFEEVLSVDALKGIADAIARQALETAIERRTRLVRVAANELRAKLCDEERSVTDPYTASLAHELRDQMRVLNCYRDALKTLDAGESGDFDAVAQNLMSEDEAMEGSEVTG